MPPLKPHLHHFFYSILLIHSSAATTTTISPSFNFSHQYITNPALLLSTLPLTEKIIDLSNNHIHFFTPSTKHNLNLANNPLVCTCTTPSTLCKFCRFPEPAACPKTCYPVSSKKLSTLSQAKITLAGDSTNVFSKNVSIKTGVPPNVQLPHKQFPDVEISKTFTGLEWTSIELRCDINWRELSKKYAKPVEVQWFQMSRWTSTGNKVSARVEPHMQRGDNLYIKYLKLKQSALYFCRAVDTTTNDIIISSEICLIGFVPNSALTASFLLTILVRGVIRIFFYVGYVILSGVLRRRRRKK